MKVGDYVRTRDGYIGKAIIITEYNTNIEDKKVVKTKDIIKSSSNIIDLIEVGDYVNGELVQDVVKYEDDKFVNTGFEHYRIEDIKSIVTKEQFEQMEYKVGEIDDNKGNDE